MSKKKADWIKIKNEYINGNISYRKLADKYGVSFTALKKRAKEEKWVDLRKEQRHKIATKVTQKSAEEIAKKEADRLARITTAADNLLSKLELAAEQLDKCIVTNKVKQEDIEYTGTDKPKRRLIKEAETKAVVETNIIDKAGLRQLTGALKELKEIEMSRLQLPNAVKKDTDKKELDLSGFTVEELRKLAQLETGGDDNAVE